MAQDGSRKTKRLVTAGVIAGVCVVVLVAGVAVYRDQVAPFRTTVLVVGDRSIDMGYFLKRVRMSGQQPLDVLQTLMNEETIKQMAPQPPYSIKVSEQEIDAALREIAGGPGDSIAQADFKEWYRQTLNESRLSNAEFRDLTRTNLLARRMTEYLAQRIPTVAEQVHLLMIPVKEPADAGVIIRRFKAGESFEALARELSSDPQLRDRGGEAGWFPRAALAPEFAEAAFDGLEVGEVTDLMTANDQTVVIMLAGRAAARQVEGESLARLKIRALDEWLKEEYKHQKVELHGFRNGYDSETDAWVKWQLQKTTKASGGGQR